VSGVARATVELARARLLLRKLTVPQMLVALPVKEAAHDPAEVERVAWLVPRVAARLPFRADCLVQALAARRWLARAGIATELTIGTRKDPVAGFVAHAWLRHGETTVTGGDFSAYVQLVSSGDTHAEGAH